MPDASTQHAACRSRGAHNEHPPSVLHIQKAVGIGGSERHIIDLCRGLTDRGWRAEVLWLEDPRRPIAPLVELCGRAGLAVARLGIRRHADPSLTRRLRALLRARQPDLVHLHLIHATLYGALAAAYRGAPPLLATRHGMEPYRRWPGFAALVRALDRRLAAVIVPSRALAEFTRTRERLPADRLHRIPHGLDVDAIARQASDPARRAAVRQAHAIAPDAFLIGAVARLHAAKDHPTLLAAFARLAAEPHAPDHSHLLLVGGGPREAALRRQAHDLGAAGARVHFAGAVPDATAYLGACDVLVLPSRSEGFGLAALEALAAGRPLIASRLPALRELLVEEETGLLYDPGDAAGLARQLARLRDAADLRQRLGAAAARAASAYTCARMTTATAALYGRLLDNRRPAR